jgi:hypothetical protein
LLPENNIAGEGSLGAFCLTQDEYFDNKNCKYFSPTVEGKCLKCGITGVAPEDCNKFKNCATIANNICTACSGDYILDENFNCVIK